ncbi:MAG: hypothetical protein JW893_05975 [Candidatus Omnitrophica bacterium]|nr:hypothetical protein [Candidatus Omnitrophota bacterium]
MEKKRNEEKRNKKLFIEDLEIRRSTSPLFFAAFTADIQNDGTEPTNPEKPVDAQPDSQSAQEIQVHPVTNLHEPNTIVPARVTPDEMWTSDFTRMGEDMVISTMAVGEEGASEYNPIRFVSSSSSPAPVPTPAPSPSPSIEASPTPHASPSPAYNPAGISPGETAGNETMPVSNVHGPSPEAASEPVLSQEIQVNSVPATPETSTAVPTRVTPEETWTSDFTRMGEEMVISTMMVGEEGTSELHPIRYFSSPSSPAPVPTPAPSPSPSLEASPAPHPSPEAASEPVPSQEIQVNPVAPAPVPTPAPSPSPNPSPSPLSSSAYVSPGQLTTMMLGEEAEIELTTMMLGEEGETVV